uniref:Uncharacterized protein n=1 Tax=Anguilla anguilla TaxID=7936 RepID=A0A0E9WJY5_ANGAN
MAEGPTELGCSSLAMTTWALTSSRPAPPPTTSTARPCPSELARSLLAPTWSAKWTTSSIAA